MAGELQQINNQGGTAGYTEKPKTQEQLQREEELGGEFDTDYSTKVLDIASNFPEDIFSEADQKSFLEKMRNFYINSGGSMDIELSANSVISSMSFEKAGDLATKDGYEKNLQIRNRLQKVLNGELVSKRVSTKTKEKPEDTPNDIPKNPQKQIEETPIQVDHIEDSPFTPKLKQLVRNGLLNVEQAQDFYDKVNGKMIHEQKQEFRLFINDNLPNTEAKKVFPDEKEVTRENFSGTDFATVGTALQLDFPEETTGLEVLLAENYSPIGVSEGTENGDQEESDIKISIQTVTNTIVTKNNKDFKENNIGAINKIRTATNIQEQYTALQDLYKAYLLKDATHLGIKNKQDIREKENDLKREYVTNRRELEAARESGDNERIQKLEQKENEIVEQAQVLDRLDTDFHLVEGELAKSEGDVYKTSEEKPLEGAES